MLKEDYVACLAAAFRVSEAQVLLTLGPRIRELGWLSNHERDHLDTILNSLDSNPINKPLTVDNLLAQSTYVYISSFAPPKTVHPQNSNTEPFRLFFLTIHAGDSLSAAKTALNSLFLYPNARWGYGGVSMQTQGRYHVHAVILTQYYTTASNMARWMAQVSDGVWDVQPVWSSFRAAVNYVAGQVIVGESLKWYPINDISDYLLLKKPPDPSTGEPQPVWRSEYHAFNQQEDIRFVNFGQKITLLPIFRTGVVVPPDRIDYMTSLWENAFMGIADVYARGPDEIQMNADFYNGQAIVVSKNGEDLSWLSEREIKRRRGGKVYNNVSVIISTTHNIPPMYSDPPPWVNYIVRQFYTRPRERL